MARMLQVVMFVLACSFFVAHSMEPLAGPLVTQTVMQAGGPCSCVGPRVCIVVNMCVIRRWHCCVVWLSEPVPVIVSYDVPQFGLMDELTELKKASLAERDLNLAQHAGMGRMRRPAAFLARRGGSIGTDATEAATELEGAIEKADAANQVGGAGADEVSLDPALAATAKKATDLLKSAAFAWDVVTNIHATPEELDVLKQLRSAVQTPSHVGSPERSAV